jgi:uncharacterized membrane protein
MNSNSASLNADVAQLRNRIAWYASVLVILLIFWLTAWELAIAPLRPNGSWMVLKVLPLLALLMGTLKGRPRSYQWGSILVWLFVCEGVVRGMSDPNASSRLMAWGELGLSLGYFGLILAYMRTYKKVAAA